MNGLKYVIALVVAGSALLTACGKKGGGGAPAASSPTSWSNTPAGYIGNGTWSGNVVASNPNSDQFIAFAAATGLCSGWGCQQNYMSLTIALRSDGYGGAYPYQPTNGQQVTTTGGFSLRGPSGGRFTRNPVYMSGGSASFQMVAGLWSQQGMAQPPQGGEPTVQINAQFSDQSQSVMQVQVYYRGNQVASGQLVCSGYSCGQYSGAGGQYPYPNNPGYPNYPTYPTYPYYPYASGANYPPPTTGGVYYGNSPRYRFQGGVYLSM